MTPDVGSHENQTPADPGEEPPSPSARTALRGLPGGTFRGGRAHAFPVGAVLLAVLALLTPGLSAQDSDPRPRAREETAPGRTREVSRDHLEVYRADTDRAIARGLRYLSERQDGAGHFGTQYPVATTALAGMAMLGDGITYGRGKYGYDVRRAVEYLTSSKVRDHSGFICERGGETQSRMHGHSYAILFLSQVVGTLPDPEEDRKVRAVVERGVQLIVDSQTVRGGWGYMPGDEADEASLTVCCLWALRAAKDAGFLVPTSKIRSAMRYLQACSKEDGSFRYSLANGGEQSTYELTAAAVSTLDAAGEYGADEHARGLIFMQRSVERIRRLGKSVFHAASRYPWYGNLYAGQVYFQLGGDAWESWSRSTWPEVIALQKGDGNWESRFGSEYATAVAILVLTIPRGYLPIYER